MVFSSLQFVFIFMPLFFSAYYAVPFKYKNIILLMGSFIFYFMGTVNNPEHFAIFVISILCDFYIGIFMEKYLRFKKLFLIFGIMFHLMLLCIFKYSDFILSELNINSFAEIALPIGISFYTFQGISYIADVYRGTVSAEKSLVEYAVYISMFPQLIAGPIVTYSCVKENLYNRKINRTRTINGIEIFIFGLAFKVLPSNPLGKLWQQVNVIGFESISTPLAWISILAYSFQIYFDFFGYSLMAVGLGHMLGFDFPKNFNHPYTATTMTEFWRKWHITLGTWFKDYVYIPLGGNKCGFIKTVLNLFTVWLLTGIWHGAGYSFLLWGITLFIIILFEKLYLKKFLNNKPILGHLYMAVIIPTTWSIFAVTDISDLAALLTRLFPFFGKSVWSTFRYDYLKYLKDYWIFLVLGLIFSTKLPYKLLKKIKNKYLIAIILASLFAGSVYCMYRGFDDPFLYFKF